MSTNNPSEIVEDPADDNQNNNQRGGGSNNNNFFDNTNNNGGNNSNNENSSNTETTSNTSTESEPSTPQEPTPEPKTEITPTIIEPTPEPQPSEEIIPDAVIPQIERAKTPPLPSTRDTILAQKPDRTKPQENIIPPSEPVNTREKVIIPPEPRTQEVLVEEIAPDTIEPETINTTNTTPSYQTTSNSNFNAQPKTDGRVVLGETTTEQSSSNTSNCFWCFLKGFLNGFLLCAFLCILLFRFRKKPENQQPKQQRKPRSKKLKILVLISISLLGSFSVIHRTFAQSTPDIILYEGQLLNADSEPVTEAVNFRISLWSSTDFSPGDINGDGTINVDAAAFSGYQEERTITPSSNGSFSIDIGSVEDLPNIDFDIHKFLQIEIKTTAAAITDYQLMDPTGDNGVDAVDRQIIGSVPYSKNSDQLQKRTIGTEENNIALLGPNGQWAISQIPGGSDSETFVIDNDNTQSDAATGNITLQFGNTLNEHLSFSLDTQSFILSDDLDIEGNISISGTITTGTGDTTITLEDGTIDGEHIADDTIDEDALDFGTALGQINAFDIPLTDNFTHSDSTNIQDTLEDFDTAISDNATNITTNTGNISDNTTDITTNTTNIANNTSDISDNETAITTNSTDITANTSDISDNTANIANNTNTIGSQTYTEDNFVTDGESISSSIDILDQEVQDNADDITTNTGNISSNTTNIATNTGNITNNASNISDNETDIATNTSNISDNATDIATNTGNISTNSNAIGNQTYTEDNFVTDGESISSSIDALDQQVQINADNITNIDTTNISGTSNNSFTVDNDDTGGNVDLIFGATVGAFLRHNGTSFVLSDSLDINGTIEAGSGNIQITLNTGELDGEHIADDTIDEDALDFGTALGQISAFDIPLTDNFTHSDSANIQDTLEDFDTAISDNATNITTNTGNITNNTSDISDNATDIATNSTNITNNASDISDNETAISTNASNITTNTSDISDNASDITTNTGNITNNANAIANNSTNITNNSSAIGNQTYTEDNFVTDGESISSSINALDQQVQDNLDTINANLNLTDINGTSSNTFTLDNDDTGGNVDLIFGTTIGAFLRHNGTSFVLSDNLDINGTIEAGSSNIQITLSTGQLDGEQIADNTIDEDALDFGTALGQISGLDIPLTDNFDNSDNTNTQNTLEDLDAAISSNETNITTNAGNIAVNTGNIATNATDITTNAGNISSNTTNITNNATNIGTNTTDIATNTTNITNNTNAFGNRLYTEDNFVTDGQSITNSIDALDQELNDIDNSNIVDGANIDFSKLATRTKRIFIPTTDFVEQDDGSNNATTVSNIVQGGSDPHFFKRVRSNGGLGAQQDVDFKIKILLPEDFVDFSSANDISLFFQTEGDDTDDATIDILVEDEDGDDAFLSTDGEGLFNNSITEFTDEFDQGSFDPQAGEYIYISIKAYANDVIILGNTDAFVGEIVITYVGR